MSRLALLGGEPIRTRPFPSWPIWDSREERALLDVLHSGKWWRFSYGEGVELQEPAVGQTRSRVAEFQDRFAARQGARFGIACANGTAALEIALKALGVGPGDEVIVPAYSFIATASAALAVNAVPIFVDVEADTLNIDARSVEHALTPRTRAIVPVHFAGQAADMGAILDMAATRGLRVVEDAAHGHGGTWRGRGLGSMGDAGTFSFQASKNMTAGEGGLVTTNRQDVASLCESYLWLGRDAGRPWYEHHRLGWNYRLTEFQAAILLQQLQRLDEQNARRVENARLLSAQLREIPGVQPLAVRPDTTNHTYHIYIFRFDELRFGIPRDRFVAALTSEGVPCFEGYAHPLYRNPMFLNQAFYPRGCPITCGHYDREIDYAAFADACPRAEQACRETVWLEHRLLLGSTEDTMSIAEAVQKIYDERRHLAARPASGGGGGA